MLNLLLFLKNSFFFNYLNYIIITFIILFITFNLSLLNFNILSINLKSFL